MEPIFPAVVDTDTESTHSVKVTETRVFLRNEKGNLQGKSRRRGRKNSESSPTFGPDVTGADAEILKAMEELNLPPCFGSSRKGHHQHQHHLYHHDQPAQQEQATTTTTTTTNVNVNVNDDESSAAELVLASSYESVSSESSEPGTTGISTSNSTSNSSSYLLWFGCFDTDYNLPFYFCEETQCSQWAAPEDGFILPLTEHVASVIETEVSPKQLLPVTKNRYKYWGKRFSLFSKFELGVSMNQTAWYSVTPEALAKHHAKKLAKYAAKGDRNRTRTNSSSLVVLDAFCGVGGNAIQFALSSKVFLVYACEIVEETVRQAKENADLYGASSKICFICSDVFHFIESTRFIAAAGGGDGPVVDILFLSPPWGGPLSSMKKRSSYSLEKFDDLALDTCEMIRKCLQISRVICLYLPKYTNLEELQKVLIKANVYQYEVEQNYVHKKLVAISVYIRQQL